jgi:hypothetical protein
MGILCCDFQKIQKLKKANSFFLEANKAFGNNIVQLNVLSNEDVVLLNVNKLKVYRKPT